MLHGEPGPAGRAPFPKINLALRGKALDIAGAIKNEIQYIQWMRIVCGVPVLCIEPAMASIPTFPGAGLPRSAVFQSDWSPGGHVML